MKNNSCSVIRDLMPLVFDRVASDDSCRMLEQHIVSCPECRNLYEEMKQEIPPEALAGFEEDRMRFKEAVQKLRTRRLLRRITALALVFAVAAAAAFCGMRLYSRLDYQAEFAVENNRYSIRLAQLRDGRVEIMGDASGIDAPFDSMIAEEGLNGGNAFYAYYRYSDHGSVPGENESKVRPISMISLDHSYDLNGYTEIRQGKPGYYTTIWKAGEAIPPASAEMEAYFAALDEYYDYRSSNGFTDEESSQPSSEELDRMYDKIMELYYKVPEWNVF